MTVGLIRGESAGDLRTLTATGATSRIRRTLTAATAAALALLGIAGAYLVLTATYLNDLGLRGFKTWVHAAARYSWISPPSRSWRSIVAAGRNRFLIRDSRREDGAFMEPSGRNRWQSVANAQRAKTAEPSQNRC
ncbi:MAG: hypothetical protein ACRDKY_06715, partial [Solirubrobacteraceae bacterium]